MGEVKAQFQMVYCGFRHKWKSALKKTVVLADSKLYLRAHTPLPYPDVGLKDTDDEADNEDEDEDKDGEDQTSNQGLWIPNQPSEQLMCPRRIQFPRLAYFVCIEFVPLFLLLFYFPSSFFKLSVIELQFLELIP
jgi:hypothetical protein